MKIEHFKNRLLKIEADLSARIERHVEQGREQTDETEVRDVGDRSVADEAMSEQFTEAEQDTGILHQVRDALKRIEDHTYGKCVVDGQPIEEKRLKAMPWTPYCLKHQEMKEGAEPRDYPTL
jgi:RNA polymerase-binding transcription factor